MTAELRSACVRALHVVTRDGQVLRSGRAVLFVLERIGWGRLVRPLRWPPLVWLVELGYWIVSRNRPLFSRLMFRRRRMEHEIPRVEELLSERPQAAPLPRQDDRAT